MAKDFPELTEGLFLFIIMVPMMVLFAMLIAGSVRGIWYLSFEWVMRKLFGKTTGTPSVSWKKRTVDASRTVAKYSAIIFVVWAPIFFWPEYYGRKAASDFCATMVKGRVIDINDINMQSASSRDYIRRIREEHSSMMLGIDFYPKEEGVPGSRDAAIFFFAAGFPFSRAACLIELENGVVKSRQVRFNAEDMMYCNGGLNHMVYCAGETASGP